MKLWKVLVEKADESLAGNLVLVFVLGVSLATVRNFYNS